MPIDTPYNRKVAKEYNEMNRSKVSYLDHSLQDVIATPVGKYAVPSFTGDNMISGMNRTIGSGVSVYNKTQDKPCPKGHKTCKCHETELLGGNNPGLNPETRMELNLGAGLGDDIKKFFEKDVKKFFEEDVKKKLEEVNNDVKKWLGEHGTELLEMGAPGPKGMNSALRPKRKAIPKKKTGGELKPNTSAGNPGMSSNMSPTGGALRSNSGAGSDGRKVRAELVKKIMKEKGLKMVDASKYVKEHNLYKK
jgi:hypothetical protein